MTIGTLAWVTTGASAIADGENTKPVTICTLSLVISSVATVLATAPVGGPSSRLMISTLLRRDVLGVQLDVKIERLVDLVAEVGIGAAERQHDADLDGLGLGGAAHRQGQGRKPSHPIIFIVVLPTP